MSLIDLGLSQVTSLNWTNSLRLFVGVVVFALDWQTKTVAAAAVALVCYLRQTMKKTKTYCWLTYLDCLYG